MSKKTLWIVTGLGSLFLFLAAAQPALAGNFDGSKPLVCAMIEVYECSPDTGCESGTPESNGLSRFLRIDFKRKAVYSTKEAKEQASRFEKPERAEGVIHLNGTQNGRGWNLSLTEATGHMVLTVADDQVGFVVFGACSPP